jgi:hypothetical protein
MSVTLRLIRIEATIDVVVGLTASINVDINL